MTLSIIDRQRYIAIFESSLLNNSYKEKTPYKELDLHKFSKILPL